MTIAMTAKHQITIPKRIAEALNLGKGTLFNIELSRNRIELIPLEVKERAFTDEDYKKLDKLVAKERRQTRPVTPKFIARLKQGKA